jgi:putative oxidoreductase
MNTIEKSAELAGRTFMAAIFLISGLGKLGQYAQTQAFMDSAGVPGELLPMVIALEVLGGGAIVLGWHTRIAALTLAGFSLLAAAVFHANFQEQIQTILFLKNVAMAGGLLLLSARGAGLWSLDRRKAYALPEPAL